MALLHQERLIGIHPDLSSAIQIWVVFPFDVLIVQGVRSDEEQQILYAQGRTAPGNIVTKARTAALSPHGRRRFDSGVWGCAIDAIPSIAGKALWQDIDKLERMADAVAGVADWGGGWQSLKDYDHFELRGWRDHDPVPDDEQPVVLEG